MNISLSCWLCHTSCGGVRDLAGSPHSYGPSPVSLSCSHSQWNPPWNLGVYSLSCFLSCLFCRLLSSTHSVLVTELLSKANLCLPLVTSLWTTFHTVTDATGTVGCLEGFPPSLWGWVFWSLHLSYHPFSRFSLREMLSLSFLASSVFLQPSGAERDKILKKKQTKKHCFFPQGWARYLRLHSVYPISRKTWAGYPELVSGWGPGWNLNVIVYMGGGWRIAGNHWLDTQTLDRQKICFKLRLTLKNDT